MTVKAGVSSNGWPLCSDPKFGVSWGSGFSEGVHVRTAKLVFKEWKPIQLEWYRGKSRL